jgi:hypothetical protein
VFLIWDEPDGGDLDTVLVEVERGGRKAARKRGGGVRIDD